MRKLVYILILSFAVLLTTGCSLEISFPTSSDSANISSSVSSSSSSSSSSTDSSSSIEKDGFYSDLTYYALANGKKGEELKSSLHDIISKHSVLSYSEVWDALKYTDEAPDDTTSVLLLYQGVNRKKSANGGNTGQWNREHVWAKSHGNFGTSNGPGTDIHHLRATDVKTNSDRGNLDFDNCTTFYDSYGNKRDTGRAFEPRDEVKGDIARMLFYMAVRYEAGDRVDLELNDNVNNGTAPYMGRLSVLLEWNLLDPVDDYEMRRNERIYEVQGNRNPFIDDMNACYYIWSV